MKRMLRELLAQILDFNVFVQDYPNSTVKLRNSTNDTNVNFPTENYTISNSKEERLQKFEALLRVISESDNRETLFNILSEDILLDLYPHAFSEMKELKEEFGITGFHLECPPRIQHILIPYVLEWIKGSRHNHQREESSCQYLKFFVKGSSYVQIMLMRTPSGFSLESSLSLMPCGRRKSQSLGKS